MLRIHNNGNVGIGMPPQSGTRLALLGSGNTTYLDINGTTKAIRFMGSGSTQPRHLITETNGDFVLDPGVANGGGNDVLLVKGKLAIGNERPDASTYPDWQLGVDGQIIAKECFIQIDDWADKVFDPKYPLIDLRLLEQYVLKNKHLPDIPAEQEILKGGMPVGEMNKLLLQKVEELTLYVIALNHEIEVLKNKVNQ